MVFMTIGTGGLVLVPSYESIGMVTLVLLVITRMLHGAWHEVERLVLLQPTLWKQQLMADEPGLPVGELGLAYSLYVWAVNSSSGSLGAAQPA